MPSIHRFLLKTLCVFGVTFTLTLPHNTAWGISQCECKPATSCTFQSSEEEDSAAWHWAQTCKNSGAYCLKNHQTWATDRNYITCPGNTVFVDGEECGCSKPWVETGEGSGSGGTCGSCYGEVVCNGGNCETYGYKRDDDDTTCNSNYKIVKANCPSNVSNYFDIKCNTGDGYYQISTLGYYAYPESIEDWSGCGKLTTLIRYNNCTGCSTTKCNDETPEWKNCGNTGMDCFDTTSVTLCAPGEADGTNGCYDPNLYERQVGYTFNASANDGNGSCTWQIKNEEWRCKAGYYPTTIQPKSSVDLQREPNFRCTPCPVGYVGAEYNDKTQTWSHDISFDNDLLVAPTNFYINSCKKCPAGQSTFLSDADAPLLYFEGADDICYPCPDGYFNDGTQNISLTVYEINGLPITPTTKSGNGCELCPQGTYSTSGATACDNCPDAFTTVLPLESDLTTHNKSIQMCYIDPNVMLSDSLGKIKLSEELGSGTKLYHQ